MSITEWSIKNKLSVLFISILLIIGGVVAFVKLGKLEDPNFTIKDAQIITEYPGASASEVEEEVTDKIEIACQQLGQLEKDYLKSKSYRGRSIVTPRMQDQYDAKKLPQVWDELRRKVGDVQANLPKGTSKSLVNDDFGDVYGVYFAITGDGYTPQEMKDFSKWLTKELLRCTDVKRVVTTAVQNEAIYIVPDKQKMSQIGIPMKNIVGAIQDRNDIVNAGHFKVDKEYLTLSVTGSFDAIDNIKQLYIPIENSNKTVQLKDIAKVYQGYVEPNNNQLVYGGKKAIGMGISTVTGGNVVNMGNSIKEKLKELEKDIPVGIEINSISFQADAVNEAISGFMVNLIEAVIIVVVVLIIFMGLRSSLIIGAILMLNILATFIVMLLNGVDIQKISLGALIIALGMLVDNAIVVLDGIHVGMQRGKDAVDSAIEVVKKNAIPLAGATAIAILAFAAIGTSQDGTGEFTRSLYQVILYSLTISWITAITVTPVLGVMFLDKPKVGEEKDPYDNKFFNGYKSILGKLIKLKWATVAVVAAFFILSMMGFGKIKKSFFPEATRNQFMVNCYLPEGTYIDSTTAMSKKVTAFIDSLSGVTNTTSIIGSGPLRFVLTMTPEEPNPSYFQVLVDVDDYKKIIGLMKQIDEGILDRFPNIIEYSEKFPMGAAGPKIECRIWGEDPDTLRMIAQEYKKIVSAKTSTIAIREDWRERVKRIDAEVANEQANNNGISIKDISDVLRNAYDGVVIGKYRESDEMLPITIRSSNQDRTDINNLYNLQIWSPKAGKMIPLTQVVSRFKIVYEDDIIARREREKVLTVLSQAPPGQLTSVTQQHLIDAIKDFQLPEGYKITWGGELENSIKAIKSLTGLLPVIFTIMFVILVLLFNSLKTPLLIWLVVPLAMIGVTSGLLLTGLPFGFMSIIGLLSLSGMLIKNAIILIDEININLSEGMQPFDAILQSGVSRLKPVGMAAGTTALGMLPLIVDPFFGAMAVTIVAGLVVATALTALVVPVLYAIFYKVKAK